MEGMLFGMDVGCASGATSPSSQVIFCCVRRRKLRRPHESRRSERRDSVYYYCTVLDRHLPARKLPLLYSATCSLNPVTIHRTE